MNDAAPSLMAYGSKLSVAGYVLDLGREALIDSEGRAVELRPQAYQVLRFLTLNAGRLVTKDELLQTVWAGKVVEEGTLASHVSMLRKALGNGLLETLPKRGYRFVGQVADDARIARAIVQPIRTMTFLLAAALTAAFAFAVVDAEPGGPVNLAGGPLDRLFEHLLDGRGEPVRGDARCASGGGYRRRFPVRGTRMPPTSTASPIPSE